MQQIDYLQGLERIPPFTEEVLALKAKYKAGVSQEYYNEFCLLKAKIISWLKKEFTMEVNDKDLFRDNGKNLAGPCYIDCNAPQNIGLDAWLTAELRPSPHGGFPGAQWYYDTSNTGVLTRTVPLLLQAYHKCLEKKKKTDEIRKHEQEQTRKQQIEYAKRRQEEEEKRRKEELNIRKKQIKIAEEYKNTLINSLHLKYLPQEKTYKPAFNEQLCNKIYQQMGKEWFDHIYDAVIRETKVQRKQMVAEHKANLERQKWEEEERKAKLLAKAIVEAQAAKEESAVMVKPRVIIKEKKE